MVLLQTVEEPSSPEARRAAPSRPVFVLGPPCSNAASLATSLTAGDEFWTSAESHLLYPLAGPDEHGQARLYSLFQAASADESFWLTKNKVVFQEFASFIGLGIDQMFLSRSNKRRWVEASTENTLIAPELAYMFPRARFLNVLRDGRDVVALMLDQGMHEDSEEGFSAACENWNIYTQRGLELLEMFPDRALEVRHERLQHDSESQADSILEFLDGVDAGPVGESLTGLARSFEDRLWVDWNGGRRERFAALCGERMQEVGYSVDWS